eukprot:TRINITY_DN12799_c0_g1_i2.p2 TRINITY_DN12799_c0_g1~~TRINITY_DN12799_c0_g1_i2.p2  ORF type:complete len:196 (-),score=30.57 TRINITY_DN12799_c0_g1_i2:5-592(-)
MKVIDPSITAEQLAIFDDSQFHALLFSLISCPGVVQQLRAKQEFHEKILMAGVPGLDGLVQAYRDEACAQQVLTTCLRAFQDIFNEPDGAAEKLVRCVNDRVAQRLCDALVSDDYDSSADADYSEEDAEATTDFYEGGSSSAFCSSSAAEDSEARIAHRSQRATAVPQPDADFDHPRYPLRARRRPGPNEGDRTD